MFVLICRDKPDGLEIRKSTREAHLAYLAEHPVAFAGPTLDDEDRPDGSIIAIDLADRAEAERFAAGDPYAKAGLFASVEIVAWRKVLG